MRCAPPADSPVDVTSSKRARYDVNQTLSVVETSSLATGARVLAEPGSDSVIVRRSLIPDALQSLEEYLASEPAWPDTEDYHPLEATYDRVALIDFAGVPSESAQPLAAASAFGRHL